MSETRRTFIKKTSVMAAGLAAGAPARRNAVDTPDARVAASLFYLRDHGQRDLTAIGCGDGEVVDVGQ